MENIIFERICNLNESMELQYITEENKIKQILILLCGIQNLNIDIIHNLLKLYYEIYPCNDITNELIDNLVNRFMELNQDNEELNQDNEIDKDNEIIDNQYQDNEELNQDINS